MLFVIAGIVLGALVVLGPLRFLAAPAEGVVTLLTDTTAGLITKGANMLSSSELASVNDLGPVPRFLSILASLATPALVALMLVMVAEGSERARRLGGGLLVALSLLSFLVLEPYSALLLVVVALVINSFFALATGLLLRMPCWALATMMTLGLLNNARAGTVSGLDAAVADIASFSGLPSGLLRLLLTGVALAPALVGVGLAVDMVDGKGRN